MKVVAVIQARIKSKRFPEKITKIIRNKTLLEHVIDNAISLNVFHEIIIATAEDEDTSFIESISKKCQVSFFKGNTNNLAKRMIDATMHLDSADSIARITADNPILFSDVAKEILRVHLEHDNDYTCAETLTHCGIEMIKLSALRSLINEDLSQYEEEHATPFFRRDNIKHKTVQIPYSTLGLIKAKDDLLTIDFPEDLIRIQHLNNQVNIFKASKADLYFELDKLLK